MKKIGLRCAKNSSHFYKSKNGRTDGLSCHNCNAPLIPIEISDARFNNLAFYEDLIVSNKKNNEIEIIMTSVNERPLVKLNGQTVGSIVNIEYEYVTSDESSNGYHNFLVKYYDGETIRTASASKLMEG